MKINITAFGIAKDIFGTRELAFSVEPGDNIAKLKEELIRSYPEFSRLSSISFAVNETYCADSYEIESGDHIVIIPPVSGG